MLNFANLTKRINLELITFRFKYPTKSLNDSLHTCPNKNKLIVE